MSTESTEAGMLVRFEREVLSTLLVYPERAEWILSLVPDEDWQADRHRAIARAALRIHEAGDALTALRLQAEMVRVGADPLEAARSISETLDGRYGDHDAALVRYARDIHQAALKRRMASEWQAGHVDAEQGYTDTTHERLEVIAEIQQLIEHAAEPPKTRAEVLAEYAERVRNPNQRPRVRTGFERLDRHCNGGLARGWLVVLQAAAKIGKSAFATNGIAPACMADLMSPCAVHIVTLEMSRDETLARWIANETNGTVPTGVQERGDLHGGQWGAFSAAQDRIAKWRWSFDEVSSSLATIAASARRQHRKEGLDLLIVDGLSQVSNGLANRTEDIDTTTRGLRRLAVELDCVVVLCVHVDKDAAQGGRPGLYDARGSGAVANDCNVCLVPFRDPKDDERAGLKVFGRSVKRVEWDLGTFRFDGARMAFGET